MTKKDIRAEINSQIDCEKALTKAVAIGKTIRIERKSDSSRLQLSAGFTRNLILEQSDLIPAVHAPSASQAVRKGHPERWPEQTRPWGCAEDVMLNPARNKAIA